MTQGIFSEKMIDGKCVNIQSSSKIMEWLCYISSFITLLQLKYVCPNVSVTVSYIFVQNICPDLKSSSVTKTE